MTGRSCNAARTGCVITNCAGQLDFTLCEVVTSPDRSYDICINGTCQSPGCGTVACNPPGPHFTLADTDQRKCYNATVVVDCSTVGGIPPSADCGDIDFCGQDSQYGWDLTHAETERFTRDNDPSGTGEPVVLDNVTGLMWQGCAEGQTDATCTGSATQANWSTALSYCDGLSWGGYNDWRLPDRYELQSIDDYSPYNPDPTIDATAFPATPTDEFWSSSSYASAVANAWCLNFYSGLMSDSPKTSTSCVRCVRGGPTPRPARFTRTVPATNQPIVTDNKTGLVWQGCAAGMTGDQTTCTGTNATYAWQAALDYCQDLSWGNQTDWRLPSLTELASIVDDHAWGPAIDATVFPATATLHAFWSSSSYTYYTPAAENVGFMYGELGGGGKTATGYYTRCVRGEP